MRKPPFRLEEELMLALQRVASFTDDVGVRLRQLDVWEQERLLVDLRKLSAMLEQAGGSSNPVGDSL